MLGAGAGVPRVVPAQTRVSPQKTEVITEYVFCHCTLFIRCAQFVCSDSCETFQAS